MKDIFNPAYTFVNHVPCAIIENEIQKILGKFDQFSAPPTCTYENPTIEGFQLSTEFYGLDHTGTNTSPLTSPPLSPAFYMHTRSQQPGVVMIRQNALIYTGLHTDPMK